MHELLTFFAQNTVLALAFALLVLGLARVVQNPPLIHLLWLLVLLKLDSRLGRWSNMPTLVRENGRAESHR